MKREEKGITLVALIITIIVLVILVAITISTAYNSGIIKQGTEGAKEYSKASENEKDVLNETTAYVESVVKQIREMLIGWEYFEEKATVNGKEGNSNNPTIPAGFKPVNTANAIWGDGIDNPSEESINNGLVIEDEAGNQFVWVPCYVEDGKKVEVASYPKYEIYQYQGINTNDVGINLADDNGWRTLNYRAYNDWTDEEAKTYGEKSVKAYGGFWIGRYEAGIPENASFYPSNKDNTYNRDRNKTTEEQEGEKVDLKPVSKAGYFSWNFINQTNAKTVSENMYKGKDDVESHLVDGRAWDTIMKWFEGTESDKGYVTNSTNKGNYSNATGAYKGRYAEHVYSIAGAGATGTGWLSATKYQNGSTTYGYQSRTKEQVQNGLFTENGTLIDDNHVFGRYIEIPTGVNENFAVKNIYDMAGNMYEWTTETSKHGQTNGQMFAVLRGGDFGNSSSTNTACIRIDSERQPEIIVDFGFRVILYVK